MAPVPELARCHPPGLTMVTMVTRTTPGIVRGWSQRLECAANLPDDDKYCLTALFRGWFAIFINAIIHHTEQGQQTHMAHTKLLFLKTTKIVLHFRLADPIAAQRLYEAQRDLRPLHREAEETLEPQPASSAQHKVGPSTIMGGYKPIIGETTQGHQTFLGQIILFSPGCEHICNAFA